MVVGAPLHALHVFALELGTAFEVVDAVDTAAQVLALIALLVGELLEEELVTDAAKVLPVAAAKATSVVSCILLFA